MKKIRSTSKNKTFIKVEILLIFISIFFVSIGYSALRGDLTISNVTGVITKESVIKVNSFIVNSSSDANSYSNSLSFSDTHVTSNVKLNNINSWVKYEIKVVNLGNEEMGIANYLETILPSNLTYEITDYSLGGSICDDDVPSNCVLNAEKTFYVTIKYKPGSVVNGSVDYNVSLGFDFKKMYNVTYSNGVCVDCISKVIETGDLTTTLQNYTYIDITENGLHVIPSRYSFDRETGVLDVYDVMGDLYISTTNYTKLEFIETTGKTDAQYILTDYTPNANTEVVYDGMVVDGDTALFGVRTTTRSSIKKFNIQYISSGVYRGGVSNSEFELPSTYVKNVRHLFKMNTSYISIDNIVVANTPTAVPNNFVSAGPLTIFAMNNVLSNVIGNFGIVRLYSFKIYENDSIVRNYIPVLDADGTPCLYETLNNEFLYNQGNGTFNYTELNYYDITNNIPYLTFSNPVATVVSKDTYTTSLIPSDGHSLPQSLLITVDGDTILTLGEEYDYNNATGLLTLYDVMGDITIDENALTEINYVISSGTQYINTGYVPTIDTRIIFTYIPMNNIFSNWVALFGFKPENNNAGAVYVSTGVTNGTSVVSAFYGGGQFDGKNISFTHTAETPEVIIMSKDEFIIRVNGVDVVNIDTTSSTPAMVNPREIFIFGRNVNGVLNYPSSIKFVSMQIYEGNETEPRMNLVPIRDIDLSLNLYDTVSETIFPNDGTGFFSGQ